MLRNLLDYYLQRKVKKAHQAFHKADYLSAIRCFKRVAASGDEKIKSEAYRMIGLSYYRKHQFADSVEFFRQAVDLTNNRYDWYNLAMSLVRDGKTNDAEETFRSINGGVSDHGYMYAISHPQMLFQYSRALRIQKEYKLALTRFHELMAMYVALHKTDSDYLLARGMPVLEHSLREVAKVCSALDKNAVDDWIRKYERGLDESGREAMVRIMKPRN